MAHTSIAGLTFTGEADDINSNAHASSPAKFLVDTLQKLVGAKGTLVMPTHAIYQSEHHLECDESSSGLLTKYNPATTPSGVGLANELFRRRKGVRRSFHPFNMVSVIGPLADELLCDNLNDTKPLPHGKYSPYYRFCQKNGLVISIGVSLGHSMTLTHVAEDMRGDTESFADFFEEKSYLVTIDGQDRIAIVRVLRPEYSMYCRCRYKYIRDLIGEGILHTGKVGSVIVEWANSREIFDYFMSRNEHSTYPYYCTWLARKKR
jgi:aminoglycoside N3'-acetyltransferase